MTPTSAGTKCMPITDEGERERHLQQAGASGGQ